MRQVLMEVYGAKIGNFCARGRANSSPGIDKTIFNNLLGKPLCITSRACLSKPSIRGGHVGCLPTVRLTQEHPQVGREGRILVLKIVGQVDTHV